MTARAMWKGVIRFAEVAVPVKLYAAVQDRDVHFRLLHRKDRQPVRQAMINPDSEAIVPYNETGRAFVTDAGDMVLLGREELEALEPQPSRDIEIVTFLPAGQIDHRWYERPYYLGPDGDTQEYLALIDALEAAAQEGLAHWVMRNKEYLGALRLYRGYPLLMSLRPAQEVIPVEALEPPRGSPLDARELAMAQRLIGMLEARFEPENYADDYRNRVLAMVEAKAKGQRVKRAPARRPRHAEEDVGSALEASLKQARKRA